MFVRGGAAGWLATSGICRLKHLGVRVFLPVPWVVWRPTLVLGALSQAGEEGRGLEVF